MIDYLNKPMRHLRSGRPKLTDEQRAIRKQVYNEKRRKRLEERERLRQEEAKKYLPCPFCKSKNVGWEWNIPEWVQCYDCKATGSYTEEGKDEAIRLWNTRA